MSIPFRCGFISLIGRPNAGKSSLINRLAGEKSCIVSHVPQTTRKNARTIITTGEAQLIFIDTPGIHTPHHVLGEHMVEQVHTATEGIDCIGLILDATRSRSGEEERLLRETLRSVRVPVLLILNKIDICTESDLLEKVRKAWSELNPREVVAVSALRGDGCDELLSQCIAYLPESPPLYPEEQLSDQSERFLAGELIREQIFLVAKEEVPHDTAVKIEEFKSPEEYPERRVLYIRATILVRRTGQKGILIGKNGAMLKNIGKTSRTALEQQFGQKVYLDLWVQVRKDWKTNPRRLQELGYL
ncbi:MAG: GTPase Era [Synergistales bacterium]|nr:GTPase Era [Synergistales bacterium]